MLAEGGTSYGHMETIARSETPWGPFEGCPHNPILTHRSTGSPIEATGHAALFHSHDHSSCMVVLGIRPQAVLGMSAGETLRCLVKAAAAALKSFSAIQTIPRNLPATG